MSMFCYQCEQAAKGNRLHRRRRLRQAARRRRPAGPAGPRPEGDRLLGRHGPRSQAAKDQEIDRFMIDGLFTTVTNVDFDADAVATLVAEATRLREQGQGALREANGRAFSGYRPRRRPALGAPRTTEPNRSSSASCTASRTTQSTPTSTRCARSSSTASRAMPPTPHHARILGKESDEIYAFTAQGAGRTCSTTASA